MSSFLLRCQTIKPGIGRVFAGDPVKSFAWFYSVSVYMPLASSLYSGCEDLLSVHFTEPTYLAIVLHFLGRRFASGLIIFFAFK
jgi:hypothetical protein